MKLGDVFNANFVQSAIHHICYLSLIADVVAVIGTLDVVFGEVDR